AKTDRRAVGTPAGRARERSIRRPRDGTHATTDARNRNDGVPAMLELRSDPAGYRALDLELLSLSPDAWRFHSLLQRHLMIDHVQNSLEHRGKDPRAARQPDRQDGTAIT